MPEKKKLVQEDPALRKRRLFQYGLVVVVAVAFAVSLIVSWIVLMPLGNYLGNVILYTVLVHFRRGNPERHRLVHLR